MSEKLRKNEQQETKLQQKAVELDDDDLDNACGGAGQSRPKNPINMPNIKMPGTKK